MHNKIIEWKEKKRAEFAEAMNLEFQGNHSIKYYGGLMEQWTADWWLSQLPSLLELLDGEVGAEQKMPELPFFVGKSIVAVERFKISGRNLEKRRIHTLIHEAQSSLK